MNQISFVVSGAETLANLDKHAFVKMGSRDAVVFCGFLWPLETFDTAFCCVRDMMKELGPNVVKVSSRYF